MTVRAYVRDDPRIRIILQIVLGLVIIFAVVTPSVIIYYGGISNSIPTWLQAVFDNFLSSPLTVPANITGIVVGAAPVVLAGVTYHHINGNRKLNHSGILFSVLAFFGIVLGILSLNILSNLDPDDNIIGGLTLISNLQDIMGMGVQTSVFYVALLFGIPGSQNHG